MYNLSKLSERLKELMFDHGNMKSEALAAEIGVMGTSVRNWINGTYEITLANAIKLADYFQCSLDYLTGLRENYETVFPRDLPPFYLRLREVMRELGITRYKIAHSKNFSDSYFTNWASGEQPKLATVCALADYLNVSLDYLVGRTDY